jgi:lipoprotein-anchoring transpeptidase ErfK/SrfK
MKFWTSLALLSFILAGCNRAPSSASASSAAAQTTAVPTAPPPIPAPPINNHVDGDELAHAVALKSQGRLGDARGLLQPLADAPNADPKILTTLSDIDTQILLTPAAAPEKVEYTVAAGDSLDKIAKKFGTTVSLIKVSNNLTRDLIRVGDRLRVYQGKFAVDVNKSENTLMLTDNGHFFKRYRVGTGQYSKTPVGEFKITTRIESPPWYRTDGKTIPFGDPQNILGTHWLGLNVSGYGIHGTWETNSIGKQVSAGCIRLLNSDVAELYTILPVGTVVTIHD